MYFLMDSNDSFSSRRILKSLKFFGIFISLLDVDKIYKCNIEGG